MHKERALEGERERERAPEAERERERERERSLWIFKSNSIMYFLTTTYKKGNLENLQQLL